VSAEAVVVTGVGPVSAIGTGVVPFWRRLAAGESGVRALTRVAAGHLPCRVAAEVDDPPVEDGGAPRAVQLARVAARLAWEDAHLECDPERLGIAVGTGLGNLDFLEAALGAGRARSPRKIFGTFAHAAACEIAEALAAQGPIETLSAGCNSGVDALGLALDWLRLGRADAVVAGGTDAELTLGFLEAMGNARVLARRFNDSPSRASRPFDADRDGEVPGEGAAFLVLEREPAARARGARIYARFEGFAHRAAGARRQGDAFNAVPDGSALARAARAALADAGVPASELSAVCAHGSGSVLGDAMEAQALRELLGPGAAELPVTSIKGALGQTGAVTPALQAIAAVLAIHHGVIPPTVNVSRLDERCPLHVVRTAQRVPLRHVLIDTVGLGAHYCAAAVFGAA
jgi:3-oxoacyl-(acyl-carrier-protein) synthase